MACFSNETKHKAAKFVMIVSIIAGILGILVLIFGILQAGKFSGYTSEYANFDISGGFATGTIVFGILTILVALLGGCTAKFKKPVFATFFMIFASIMFILLCIAGALMVGGSDQIKNQAQKVCDAEMNGKTVGENIAMQYKSFIDSKMCTNICPCMDGAKTLWDSYDDSVLRMAKYMRTNKPLQTETSAYDTASDDGFYYDGIIPLKFGAPASKTDAVLVKTFQQCYDTYLNAKLDKESSNSGNKFDKYRDQANLFFKKGGFDMLKSFESNYDCAGVCEKPLFYLTKEVREGWVT